MDADSKAFPMTTPPATPLPAQSEQADQPKHGLNDTTPADSNKRMKIEEPNDNEQTDDGCVPPYITLRMEVRPPLVIYHPAFTAAEEIIAKICRRFIDIYTKLKQAGYVNDEIEKICEDGLKRWCYPQQQYPKIRPVVCMGPSGVGKSSAVTCILDKQKIAAQNDSDRGTYVAHEYTKARPKQTAMYEVHVPYLCKAKIEERVRQQYRSIHTYQSGNKSKREDHEDLQEDYDTALEFFHTMLCNHTEFETRRATKTYFQEKMPEADNNGDDDESENEDEDEDDDEVIEELIRYIDDFLETRNLVDGYEIFAAETDNELSTIFKTVSRPSKDQSNNVRTPSPWPIITKVQVRCDVDLLNAGVVLADTAGISDNNRAVVQGTKSYIESAGTVLVFLSQQRIECDPALDEILRNIILMGKMDEVRLVVTKIDDKKLYSEEDKANLPERDRNLLDKAEGRLELLTAERDSLRESLRRARKATRIDYAKQADTHDRLEEIRIKEAAAGADILQITIQIRNREIRLKLKDRLRALDKTDDAPDLPIYFTSSQAYQKHMRGYDICEPPSLDIEATGFLALRRLLYDIPAYGKLTTLMRVSEHRLRMHFNGILGVATKSPLERKDEVGRTLETALGAYTSPIEDAALQIKQKFRECMLVTIECKEAEWEGAAETLLETWKTMKAGTFAAFCRRHGWWRLPKSGKPMSWNSLINAIPEKELARTFDVFTHDTLEPRCIAVLDKFIALFEELENTLDDCVAFQGIDLQPFFAQIRYAKNRFSRDFRERLQKLEREVKLVRSASTMDIKGSATYTAIAMEKAYQECLQMSATSYTSFGQVKRTHGRVKVHDMRVAHVRDKFRGENQTSVFAEVGQLAIEELDRVIDEWAAGRTKAIVHCCKEIMEDFQKRFGSCEDEVKQENTEAVGTLKDAVCRAQKMIEGPLKENIAKCEKHERRYKELTAGGWTGEKGDVSCP